MARCEWCKEEFEAREPEQAYCKPLHAKKASRSRSRARNSLATVGRCHTPYKAVFQNQEHAIARGMKPTQKLYRCECGALHAYTYRKDTTDVG